MDLKQSPFSIYDFLGYLFPGAIAIFSFEYIFDYLGMDTGLTELTALTKASALLPFVLTSYIVGHLLSLLSSFTVERFYIWMFDYPSKSLLNYDGAGAFEKNFSSLNCVKFVCAIILAPVSLAVSVLCFFSAGRPGLAQSMDSLLTGILRVKIVRLLIDRGQIENPNTYAGPMSSDFFRFVYHHALESAPSHAGKMQNYVALFGFHRAMSFLFCIIFWVGLVSLLSSPSPSSARAVLIPSTLAILFFFGFAKFYRRFSLEALMAMAVTYRYPEMISKVDLPKVHPSERKRFGSKRVSRFNAVMNDLNRKVRLRRRSSKPDAGK